MAFVDYIKNLSHQTKGLILLFSSVPLIAYVKWEFNDHIMLGGIISVMMGLAVIELGKSDGAPAEESLQKPLQQPLEQPLQEPVITGESEKGAGV